MKSLTKRMQEIVDLMNEGWEIGRSISCDSRVWIQSNGVGRGGESQTVHSNTFFGLLNRNVIECTSSTFPTAKYRLSEKWANRAATDAAGTDV